MTREEADKLQKVLDDYAEMRDAGNKGAKALKFQLAIYLSRIIPDIKIGGVNATMFLGPLAKLFSPELASKMEPMKVSVVDGHEEWEPVHAAGRELGPGEMLWPEFEEKYCIRVPGDLAQEALNHKSTSIMADMMFEKAKKEFEKK